MSKSNKTLSAKMGDLLISDPFLPDINFSRSVIILAAHNLEGTVGFVLDQPLSINLNEVWDKCEPTDIPLFLGGPVQPETMHFIHTNKYDFPNSIEISKGIFWGTDFEMALMFINDLKLYDKNNIKFFIGYSGWAPNQLDEELKENSWLIEPSNQEYAFMSETKNLWKTIVKKKGGKYQWLSEAPVDPDLN